MRNTDLQTQAGPNTLALRRHYGLSRKSLAMLTGIPVSRLRRLEAGDPAAKVYDFELLRLTRVFAVPMEVLLDGTIK